MTLYHSIVFYYKNDFGNINPINKTAVAISLAAFEEIVSLGLPDSHCGLSPIKSGLTYSFTQ